MPFAELYQLDLPAEFPLTECEAFCRAVRSRVDTKSDAWREFGGASNLVAWRFRACVEYREQYLQSWRTRPMAGFEELYARERAFVAMFVSGVSAIESTVYACYAAGSHPAVIGLPFDEKIRRSRSGPAHFKNALEGLQSGALMVATLETMLASDEWRIWKSYRNTMAHRSNIHRIVYASIGSTPPPERIMQFAGNWSHDPMDGDEGAFIALGTWLRSTIKVLLIAGEVLVLNSQGRR